MQLFEYLRARIAWAMPGTSTQMQARRILGRHLIVPAELQGRAGIPSYERDQLITRSQFPNRRVLRALRRGGFVLIPGPPSPMTLIEIIDLDPQRWRGVAGSWDPAWDRAHRRHLSNKQRLGSVREHTAKAAWIAVKVVAPRASVGKPLADQVRALEANERIATAPEMAWAMLVCDHVGIKLNHNVRARTASTNRFDDNITLVRFGDDKQFECSQEHPDRSQSGVGLGIAHTL